MVSTGHSRFIVCKDDASYVTEAMLQLILLYARQPLNKESQIDGEDKVHCSAEL